MSRIWTGYSLRPFIVWVCGVVCCLSVSEAKAGWLDTHWTYRVPITIGSPRNLSDYQVKLIVSTNSRMRSDFGDIRFTRADGTTPLSYWMDRRVNAGNAVFWIRVPSVPATGAVIYMYFGKRNAKTTSSGTKTFRVFEGFDDKPTGQNPVSGWTEIGTANGDFSVVNSARCPTSLKAGYFNQWGSGPCPASRYRVYKGIGAHTNNFAWDFYAKAPRNDRKVLMELTDEIFRKLTVTLKFGENGQIGYYTAGEWHNLRPYRSNTWYEFSILNVDFAAGRYDLLIDGVMVGRHLGFYQPASRIANMTFVGDCTSPGAAWFDDVRIRNYAGVNPTMTFGATSTISSIHYVSPSGAHIAPYTNWQTAATNIQAAINAAKAGDTVLVTNGVYASGGAVVYGSLTNRIAITKPITVRSVNGPKATVIKGQGSSGDEAVRCAYVGSNACLIGFTLTNGSTRASGDLIKERSGGGVWCKSPSAVLSNCVLTGNSACGGGYGSSVSGGGAYGGTLYNCILMGNSADNGGGAAGSMLYNCTLTGNNLDHGRGGGAYNCTLYNCTLTGNRAGGSYYTGRGGGACNCTFYNCTLVGNSASYGGGADGGTFYNCTLMGNGAVYDGGGMYGGTLYNCTLTGNRAMGHSFGGRGGGVSGGTLYNCTLTGNRAVDGGGANYATLYNCALTGNSAVHAGGGADGGTLYNCILTGNSAVYAGGGVSGGTFYNCILTGNRASYGGGMFDSTLYNCTLTGNSAVDGGGAGDGTLYNCIIYYNTTQNYSLCTLNYCCTTPVYGGTGNITNGPMFADRAVGNLRLLSNSPCVNAGTNQNWMIGAKDLDGNPRIYGGGRVDMGAYEYQGSVSMIPTTWLVQCGLPIDGSEDHGDTDGDGMDNWREWRCDTSPTNRSSFLDLTPSFATAASEGEGVVLSWQSVEGARYRLKRSTNLSTDGFGYLVRTNIPATPPFNTETDTTAVGSGPWFYRVGVE